MNYSIVTTRKHVLYTYLMAKLYCFQGKSYTAYSPIKMIDVIVKNCITRSNLHHDIYIFKYRKKTTSCDK